MATYRYFTADLRTNAVLEELDLKSVSFTDELSEPGEFSGAVDMFDLTAARVRAIKEATQTARTALFVDLDGELQWGGIIWKRRKTSGGAMEINGAGFLSFFARQRIAQTAAFAAVEQFAIVRSLLAYVQSKPGGNIGVTLGTGGSGVIRDRTYPGIDRKQVLEAVQQLSQVIDGFDLAILSRYDTSGLPSKLLTLGYPKLGRSAEATELVLSYPGNVASYSWPEEGDRMVDTVYVRGEGEGDSTPTATATNEALLSGGYPSLEDEFTASGVTVQATLDGHAAAYLAAYAGPVVLPEFTIAAGTADPPLSAYGPGDEFLVEITDPEWHPANDDGTPGYTGSMRVVKRSVKPDPGGAGQDVTLTMSPFLGAV
jgi:hypothetical protein